MESKTIIGTLVIAMIAVGVFTIDFTGDDGVAKIRIDEDRSSFYTQVGNRLLVSGREYNRLFDGNSILYRDRKGIQVFNETIGDTIKMTE